MKKTLFDTLITELKKDNFFIVGKVSRNSVNERCLKISFPKDFKPTYFFIEPFYMVEDLNNISHWAMLVDHPDSDEAGSASNIKDIHDFMVDSNLIEDYKSKKLIKNYKNKKLI